MSREIKLDGGEISMLKAIGLTGASMSGKQLRERAGGMESAEFLDTLQGLLTQDYILADKVNVRTIEDADAALFHVNPAHARELRDALVPGRRERERPRRRRRG